MDATIRHESSHDGAEIRNVHRSAFGGVAEADLVDALRDGGHVELSLVAETSGHVVGHVLFSRLIMHTQFGVADSLALAPMAILPTHQRRGIGTALVEVGLEEAKGQGHHSVFVLGHPRFYRRLGFSSNLAQQFESPFGGGDAWLALELVPGTIQDVHGQVEYPPPFRNLA